MLSATSAEVTLSRLDCSITLDISTGSNGETLVANLPAVPEVGSSNGSARIARRAIAEDDSEEEEDDEKRSEEEQSSGEKAQENGNERETVSLLALGGGVRATHGIVKGRGCYEVYVKSLVDENSPAEIIIGASPADSSLMIGADEQGVGLRNDGHIIRDGAVEENHSDKKDPIMVGFYVTCCIDCYVGELSFFVNGRFARKTLMPATFESGETVMFPHICLKNCTVHVNFAKFKCKVPNETPLAMLPGASLVRSPFQKPSKPEVVMMIGPASAGKSTKAQEYAAARQTARTTVISLEQVAQMVASDPQRLALTWEELASYYNKVVPLLQQLAGQKPFQNYILDDINGDPAQRGEILAHFPSTAFTRVAIVVMPECEQLLNYHSKRKDVWKRRYTSQELVDHLTASIQAPTASEFDEILYMGQDSQAKVEEALQLYIQKAQNRVRHYLDESNGQQEPDDREEEPFSLAAPTFSVKSDEHPSSEQGSNDSGQHDDDGDDRFAQETRDEDEDETRDGEQEMPPAETPTPVEDDDIKYMQTIASQCSSVSSRWPSLRRTRSKQSYLQYDVKVMFIVESVDFNKLEGNSHRFIRVSNRAGAQEVRGTESHEEEEGYEEEEGMDDARLEAANPDDEFAAEDEVDVHDRRGAGLHVDMSSSNPVKLLLSGVVERRKVERLARQAKARSSQKQQQPKDKQASTTKQAKPSGVLASPEQYSFGVSAVASKSTAIKKAKPAAVAVRSSNLDALSSDDDIPLVQDIARKSREQARSARRPKPVASAAVGLNEEDEDEQEQRTVAQASTRKPQPKTSVRYRPGGQAAAAAAATAESAKLSFNGVAVSHLGDHEHRVRGRLAVPDGSKVGFPTTRGFVATAKNTPDIPYFQHQKMRAMLESSKGSGDSTIPMLPQQSGEKKRAYELAWDDVGRRTNKRTLAQRQDMIAPGIPAPLSDP